MNRDGTQVVTEDYITDSLDPCFSPSASTGYGYLWKMETEYGVFYTLRWNGVGMYVNPNLQLIAVYMSSDAQPIDSTTLAEALEIFEEYVIGACN